MYLSEGGLSTTAPDTNSDGVVTVAATTEIAARTVNTIIHPSHRKDSIFAGVSGSATPS